MTTKPTRRIAIVPRGRNELQLLGRTSGTGATKDAIGSEFWRSGGMHGNMLTTLDADPIHDQLVLTELRKELRTIDVELNLISGHVITAKAKGLKQLQAWYLVWRFCARRGIRLHPFAWSSEWRSVTN